MRRQQDRSASASPHIGRLRSGARRRRRQEENVSSSAASSSVTEEPPARRGFLALPPTPATTTSASYSPWMSRRGAAGSGAGGGAAGSGAGGAGGGGGGGGLSFPWRLSSSPATSKSTSTPTPSLTYRPQPHPSPTSLLPAAFVDIETTREQQRLSQQTTLLLHLQEIMPDYRAGLAQAATSTNALTKTYQLLVVDFPTLDDSDIVQQQLTLSSVVAQPPSKHPFRSHSAPMAAAPASSTSPQHQGVSASPTLAAVATSTTTPKTPPESPKSQTSTASAPKSPKPLFLQWLSHAATLTSSPTTRTAAAPVITSSPFISNSEPFFLPPAAAPQPITPLTSNTSSMQQYRRATVGSPPRQHYPETDDEAWTRVQQQWTNPLLLLADAERHYYEQEWTSGTNADVLVKLYQRLIKDFEQLLSTQVQPWIQTDAATSSSPDPQKFHLDAAAQSLSKDLHKLMTHCRIRSQGLSVYSSLFATMSAAAKTAMTGTGTSSSAVASEAAATAAAAAEASTTFTAGQGSVNNDDFHDNEEKWQEACASVDRLLEMIQTTWHRPEEEKDSQSTKTLRSKPQPSPPAYPLYEAVQQELKAWKYCLQAIRALERCQFLETLVSLRQYKNCLWSSSSDTRLVQWFRTSYQRVASLVPLYMDRIQAFSHPLHGFDTTKWKSNNSDGTSSSSSTTSSIATGGTTAALHREDWDTLILDFLRRQEKVGGPPTVVTIVLDAQSTSNLHVERGFRLQHRSMNTQNISSSALANGTTGKDAEDSADDPRVLWPAVYLRSTMHLPSTTSDQRTSISRGSGLFRNASSSQSGLLSNWSSDSSPLTTSKKSPNVMSSKSGSSGTDDKSAAWHILDYGPDEGGSTKWPHSDWQSLVALLDPAHLNLPPALTASTDAVAADAKGEGQPTENKESTTDEGEVGGDSDRDVTKIRANSSTDEAASLFSVGLERSPQPSPQAKSSPSSRNVGKTKPSSFYVVSLARYLSMVVMVKGEEESLWNRRRNRLDDEDIQIFLNDMAQKLSVANLFVANQSARQSSRRRRRQKVPLLELSESMAAWDDQHVRAYLNQLKEGCDKLQQPRHRGVTSSPSRSPRSPSLTAASSANSTPVMGRGPEQSPRWLLRQRRRQRQQQHMWWQWIQLSCSVLSESAAILFLGPELAGFINNASVVSSTPSSH